MNIYKRDDQIVKTAHFRPGIVFLNKYNKQLQLFLGEYLMMTGPLRKPLLSIRHGFEITLGS